MRAKALLASGISILSCMAAQPWADAWPMEWAGGPDNAKLAATGADSAFGVEGTTEHFSNNGKLRVRLIESSAPANIFWPGEKAVLKIQVENLTSERISAKGFLETVQYSLRTPGEDVFKQEFQKIGSAGRKELSLDIPPKGYQDFEIDSSLPERFGGYAAVLEIEGMPRVLGAIVCRVMKPKDSSAAKPFPVVMMDLPYVDVLKRLGASKNRVAVSFTPPQAPNYKAWHDALAKDMKELKEAGISTSLEFAHGVWDGMQPGGKERKSPSGIYDVCWLPEYDKDFTETVRQACLEFGWPKGPVVGVKLWNEPWEGGSICHYGGNVPRYRQMYLAMAKGVEKARAENPDLLVLLGGCDSTSNTFDKLFCDGTDVFLPYLDFCSVHYQGLNIPSFYKKWMGREVDGKPSPVKVWDTESWVANSDERVAPVLAAYRSVGYARVVGIFGDGVLCGVEHQSVRDGSGIKKTFLKRPWSVCAAVAAFSSLVGDRSFKEFLFKRGLPYVMVFDGLPGASGAADLEDGTVVVVGDLDPAFHGQCLPYRGVKKADAKMSISAPSACGFGLYDNYGNSVPAKDGKIELPLSGEGFYLRGNGEKGSFARLLDALKGARIEGYDPVEIVARDMTAPLESGPSLRIVLNNVLNRPLKGKLKASLGSLTLKAPETELSLAPNEVREISIPVEGKASLDNCYALKAVFDAGSDGKVALEETMHVNSIAKRTVEVDGRLDEWKGVAPQPLSGGASGPTVTELAWRPWEKFPSSSGGGFALGYLAYDSENFYFAAKIANSPKDDSDWKYYGRDDSSYFWPKDKWPAGSEPFSYWKAPELPSGSFPNHDNVQIGFGVLKESEKQFLPFPPGTRPGYGLSETFDYEYALNRDEIFCLKAPGMVEKNFYPKQPAGPKGGPLKSGKLVTRYDGDTRYVECSIPWSEIPEAKRLLDEGSPLKFSFRVNYAKGIGGCMELSRMRSVSERNDGFHVAWQEHWTNELEFGFEK